MDPRVAELEPIIELFGLGAPTIAETRRAFRAFAEQIPAPEGVTVEADRIAGREAVRLRRSDGEPAGRVLYLHGGGYVVGDTDVQLSVPGVLALATDHEVVSVDYRLAPEHPCPAALEDAVAAHEALLEEGPVAAVAGDSAGGALAVLTATAARDAGLPLPGAIVAFSPWCDLVGAGARHRDEAFVDAVLPRGFLQRAAAAWLGDRRADDPMATPLAADLSGLPPTLVHVGGDEVVLDDAVALVDRLARAGVDAALHVWPAMIHVFVAYPQLTPEADQALAEVAALLARLDAAG